MIVYLPVEIRPRELNAKLFLARQLVQHGATVVIGRVDVLYAHCVTAKPGIYLEKTLLSGNMSRVETLKRQGHSIAFLDEEAGIIYRDCKPFFERRVDRRAFGLVDLFCMWSDSQADDFRRTFPGESAAIAVTGSPRLDYWRALGVQASALYQRRRENGRFRLLLSSNFGIKRKRELGGSNLRHIEIRRAKDAIFERIVRDLASIVNEFSWLDLTVRPHPTEDASAWQPLTEQSSRIRIDDGGCSLAEQIAEHDGLMHSGCTAAFEAAVVGRPILYFDPAGLREALDVTGGDATANLGYVAETTEELRRAIVRLRDDGQWAETLVTSARKEINLSGMPIDGSASSRLLKSFSSLKEKAQKGSSVRQREWAEYARDRWAIFKTGLRNSMLAPLIKGGRVAEIKCPVIESAHIEGELKMLDGSSSELRLEKVCRNLYKISRK